MDSSFWVDTRAICCLIVKKVLVGNVLIDMIKEFPFLSTILASTSALKIFLQMLSLRNEKRIFIFSNGKFSLANNIQRGQS